MKAKTPYKKTKKRVGRGRASGSGKTCGRGEKGQKSRSGGGKGIYFEGGQTPFYRRIPKRGFNNPTRKEFTVINVGVLAGLGESTVDESTLKAKGLVKKVEYALKVLGHGEIDKAIEIRANAFTKQAKEKIEKAGGKAVIIEFKKPETEKVSG